MSFDPTDAHAPAETVSDADIAARNRLVIGLLLVSTFVVILNETIMSVAIPRLMVDLDVTASAAQWLTAGFMLTMAVVIPITGFLIQRFNTRPIFIAAMSLFSVGTLLCAIAPSLAPLLFGRVVQACGTAIMIPLLMTTVMTLVPPQSRGKTMGNISIVISVAPAIGPTISGFILNYLTWRWMFWLVLPIALASLALGYMRMKNVTTPRIAPIDILSVVLSAVGFGGLVYGLSSFGEGAGGEHGAVPIWVPIGLGVIGIAMFVARQLILQREEKALLDLRTFRFKLFTVSTIMMALAMMSLFGVIILLPLYMQNVLGMDALQTGLLLLPGGLVMGLLAPFVGRLYDRIGPAKLVIPGSIIVSGVLWSLTFMDQNTAFGWLLAAHVTLSVGLALLFTPLFTASLGSLPAHLYSHGSAIIGALQQVAGAAGTALFVALMSVQAAVLVADGFAPVAATAGGIRLAFQVGGLLSLLMVLSAFFIRKPDDSEVSGEPVPEH
ncbi:MDR family MFS transporter [Pelagibacterium xiamenense]|uniref:MDR family MFS transporter n=1 Tax=Pelagibacterium xiamenense TaxID=2901140 RepID=UPI001E546516|nr:MDR family MFS transporter [Pelagibacterium xiamenense]MCD7060781.1 DHA2 family efflux MFS transporter permease subunit [Pelagibacterium xiamenense]